MNFDDYSTSYELFYDRNFPLAKKYKPNSIYLHRLPESIPTPVDSVKINLYVFFFKKAGIFIDITIGFVKGVSIF